MNIAFFSSETAKFELVREPDGEVKLCFMDGDVLVWLSEMTAQRLLGELARLYPAPPLTEADVDQLAARYAETHAGDRGVHTNDCTVCGGKGYVVGWNFQNQRASLVCSACQGQGSVALQPVERQLAMEAS